MSDDIFENSDQKRSKVRSRLLLNPDSTWSGVSLFEINGELLKINFGFCGFEARAIKIVKKNL